MNTATETTQHAAPLPFDAQAVRVNSIMALPVWRFADLATVIGVAESTLEVVTRDHPAPFFTVGRLRHILRDSALAWIEEHAEMYARPHAKKTNAGNRAKK